MEVLGSECGVDYVWDDLTLPHKLVVLVNGNHDLNTLLYSFSSFSQWLTILR